MKAYLKSGKTIRITQDQAEEIKAMKIKGEDDLLVSGYKFDPKHRLNFMIDVNEVIAIK